MDFIQLNLDKFYNTWIFEYFLDSNVNNNNTEKSSFCIEELDFRGYVYKANENLIWEDLYNNGINNSNTLTHQQDKSYLKINKNELANINSNKEILIHTENELKSINNIKSFSVIVIYCNSLSINAGNQREDENILFGVKEDNFPFASSYGFVFSLNHKYIKLKDSILLDNIDVTIESGTLISFYIFPYSIQLFIDNKLIYCTEDNFDYLISSSCYGYFSSSFNENFVCRLVEEYK